MALMRSAASSPAPFVPAMKTEPSSWMSIVAPVSSWMPRMTLPPEPMTSRILSVGMLRLMICGAVSLVWARGAGI